MEYTYTKNYSLFVWNSNLTSVLYFSLLYLATLLSGPSVVLSAQHPFLLLLASAPWFSSGELLFPILIAICDLCLIDPHFLPLPPLEHMTQAWAEGCFPLKNSDWLRDRHVSQDKSMRTLPQVFAGITGTDKLSFHQGCWTGRMLGWHWLVASLPPSGEHLPKSKSDPEESKLRADSSRAHHFAYLDLATLGLLIVIISQTCIHVCT